MDFTLKMNCTLTAGCSGSGKTTLALKHMINADGVAVRFIFDYKGEFAQRLRIKPCFTEAQLEKALATKWVIFNPHIKFPGRINEAFLWFCTWLFEASKRGPGRKLVYIDEAWKYCTPHKIPEELAIIVQTGRMEGIESFFMTQRPNRLNESILNEVTEYICFRLQGDNAIRTAIEAGIPEGIPASLPKGHFYAVNTDTGVYLRGRVF